jgi:hypothetical protein
MLQDEAQHKRTIEFPDLKFCGKRAGPFPLGTYFIKVDWHLARHPKTPDFNSINEK